MFLDFKDYSWKTNVTAQSLKVVFKESRKLYTTRHCQSNYRHVYTTQRRQRNYRGAIACAVTRLDLADTALSECARHKRQILDDSTYMRSLESSHSERRKRGFSGAGE